MANDFEDVDFAIIDPLFSINVTTLSDNFRECERFRYLSSLYQDRKVDNKYGLEGTL